MTGVDGHRMYAHISMRKVERVIKQEMRRGIRRLTSLGALTALAGGALTMGLVAPAHAVDNVSGSVVDAAGNPVQGFLSVYKADDSYVVSDYVRNGHIGLALPAGSYKLEFEPDDPKLVDEFYLNKATLGTADVVAVAGAGVALQPWTIDRRPFVTGTVTDAAGRPVSDAFVEATNAVTDSYAGGTYADEKGVFTLPVYTPDVKLEFSADDFATEFYNDKPTRFAADPVTATSAGVNVGTVVLTAGSSINGVVTSDAGAALELVTVIAEETTTGRTEVDRTDKTGAYHVEGLTPGSYALHFVDSLDEYVSEYYNNAATRAAATPVAVGKDAPVGVPTVTLTPAPVVAPDSPVDVTGAVLDDAGTPIAGVSVAAYNTPADPDDRIRVEQAFTNRAGIYSFTTLDQVPNENQFKLVASGFSEREDTTFGARTNWFGDSISYENAGVVTTSAVPVGGANISMEYYGGIAGTVTSEAGLSVADAYVVFYSADGSEYTYADVKTDGTYETRDLVPGSYKVLFGEGEHVSEWWDNARVEDAKTVNVKTDALTGGINAALGNVLKAVERPSTSDYPWVGTAITADRGRWNQEAGSKFTYEWLAGGTVVATGQSFVPTAALIGKKLSVRVTNQNRLLKASATSSSTQKVGLKPKVKAKAQGKSLAIKVKVKGLKTKKIKGSVTVKEIVGVKNNGELKLKKVGKAKVKKGKATVSLAKLKKDKAKDKLQVVFKGKGKAGSTEITKKVKR